MVEPTKLTSYSELHLVFNILIRTSCCNFQIEPLPHRLPKGSHFKLFVIYPFDFIPFR